MRDAKPCHAVPVSFKAERLIRSQSSLKGLYCCRKPREKLCCWTRKCNLTQHTHLLSAETCLQNHRDQLNEETAKSH